MPPYASVMMVFEVIFLAALIHTTFFFACADGDVRFVLGVLMWPSLKRALFTPPLRRIGPLAVAQYEPRWPFVSL